jgi:hypothetical protein
MLAYLAGDDDIQTAAAQVWERSGNLLDAQRRLETATDAYFRAITDSGIPSADAERLGAALILRLSCAAMLTELECADPDD